MDVGSGLAHRLLRRLHLGRVAHSAKEEQPRTPSRRRQLHSGQVAIVADVNEGRRGPRWVLECVQLHVSCLGLAKSVGDHSAGVSRQADLRHLQIENGT